MSIRRPLIARPIAPLLAPLIGGTGLPWESGGGGGVWTPAALGSKLTLWLDQRDQIVTGAGVSDWGDQSPAGTSDYTQGTDANRPPLSSINGLSAPDFDGSADSMSGPNSNALFGASAFHFFCVIDTTGETLAADNATSYAEASIFGNAGGGALTLSWSTSGPRATVYAGAAYATAREAGLAVGKRLFEVGWASNVLSMRVDNLTPITVATAGTRGFDATTRLGIAYSSSARVPGRYGTVIVTNAACSATEVAAVRSYLAARYGVTA